jgi:hypothetical protein
VIESYVHGIAALAVCSRIADVWTTYQVTPTLKLEANSFVSRFGWRFALLTILAGVIPYFSPPLGVIIFTMSFMVAAFNASKIFMAKALGEDELAALIHKAILATPPWPGLLFLVMPGIFIGILGVSMLFFYSQETQWGYYFGIGMLAYAFVVFVWYPTHFFRVRREAGKAG